MSISSRISIFTHKCTHFVSMVTHNNNNGDVHFREKQTSKMDGRNVRDLEIGEQVLNYLASGIMELDQYILAEAKGKEIECLITLR